MTGKVVAIRVGAGETIEEGTVLVVLEAMKMEYRLTAPRAGVVEKIQCAEGELVDLGRRSSRSSSSPRRRPHDGSALMIRIVEVGPRDGLQNEPRLLPTTAKIAFVDALSATGVAEIEASAFVSPRWVPQLADAEAVFAGIARRPGVVYSALVPNEHGLDRAFAARAERIALFTAASETFNRKNINATIAESIARFVPVARRARAAALPLRAYVSTAFWCPTRGRSRPRASCRSSNSYSSSASRRSRSGTPSGRPRPPTWMRSSISSSRASRRGASPALPRHVRPCRANVRAALARGIATFDSSAGGIGGCPYAPGASGNIATEALADTLEAAGATVHVDRAALARATALIGAALGRRGESQLSPWSRAPGPGLETTESPGTRGISRGRPGRARPMGRDS